MLRVVSWGNVSDRTWMHAESGRNQVNAIKSAVDY
jgi:hypothetical protein